MKGLKCIKLLILSTIFLPLFGICSSASALKYEITDFPLASPNNIGTALAPSSTFQITFDSSSYLPSLKQDRYIVNELSSESNVCRHRVNSFPHIWSSSSNTVIGGFPYYVSWLSNEFVDDKLACMTSFDYSQSVSDRLELDYNNITPISTRYYFADLLPSWTPYSFAYVTDINTDNGLNRRSRLSLSNLFDSVPASSFGHIQAMTIPLGYPEINFGINDSLQFEFESDLDSNSTPNANFDISNLGIRLQVLDYTSLLDSSSCSVSLIDRRVSDPDLYPYTLKYTCNYTFSSLPQDYDYRRINFNLQFYRLDFNISSIFDYPADVFTFYTSYLITNNDSSPAGRSFVSLRFGGDLASAPGSASDPSSSTSEDWLSSLTNLFIFNFINPFAPLFTLFNDNSTCTSIPILADMLHAEETTYCPWFPSSVRNILTPVFGLASTMLIFGFLVRWLGSSSGNNFEDSSDHSWGNFKIGGKK